MQNSFKLHTSTCILKTFFYILVWVTFVIFILNYEIDVRLYPPLMQFYELSFGGFFFSILVIFVWTLIVLKNLCHFSKSYVKISSYVHKIDNDIFKKFYLWKLSSLFLMYALIMILLAIHTLKMLITLLQESPPPIILYSNTFHIPFWEDKVKWQVYLTIYCSYDTKVILIFWG